MSRSVRVDVYFDFICPWCLIGKHQLEQALSLFHAIHPQVAVDVIWQGAQLLPHLPAEGKPFKEFYLNRLGSVEAMRMRQAQVQQAAAAVGLNIDLMLIDNMPNTADAHRLLERAALLGSQEQYDRLLNRLFAAYFHLGEDLGCRATLLHIAESCGFNRVAIADCLQGDGTPYVGFAMAANSVPCFRFGQGLTIAGAQPAEVLFEALSEALRQSDFEHQPS
ncbi:DsbA family oxidoreductase [Pseudomonas sp. NA-150]|uniref:DsbA family oxidoreductase n=1 Tax=Pseudomonas sp. NA-150 TaxID=3367525 RepID=UPI0037C61A60